MNRYEFARDGITQSLMGSFMACRVLCKWKLQRWTTTKIAGPMLYGNLFHAAQLHFYDRMSILDKRTAHLAKHQSVVAPINPYDSVKFAERDQRAAVKKTKMVWTPDDEQTFEIAIAMLEVMFPAYVYHYAKKDAKLKWIATEHEFDVPYRARSGASQTTLRGKLDAMFETGKKKLWIRDTKTKSRIEEATLIDLLTLDLQIGFYILAVELMTKRPVDGFMYDIVRRPELKLNVKETIGQFQKRIAADIKKRPEHYFKRLNMQLTAGDRARFQFDLNSVLWEFESWLKGDSNYPTYHRTSACMTRYGACRYLPLCARKDFTGFIQRDDLFAELEG